MMLFSTAIVVFLDEAQSRGLASTSLILYRNELEDLREHLRKRKVRSVQEVGLKDLESWFQRLHADGISAGVRRARVFLVKRLFQMLRERGDLLNDPARDLEVPKTGDPLPRNPPRFQRIEAVLRVIASDTALGLRDQALVLTLYGCMLRVGEAVALNLNDLDLDDGVLMVRKGKGGRDRALPVPERTREALWAYFECRKKLFGVRKPDGDARHAVFITRRGHRLNSQTARNNLQKYGRLAGLKNLHPHLLRHAGAVHMLRGKADIRYLQEILGHSDLETTKRYLSLVPSDLKRAYDEAFPVLRV